MFAYTIKRQLATDFHCIDIKYILYVAQKDKSQTGLEQHEGE